MAGPLASPDAGSSEEKPSSSLFGGLLRALYPAGQYEGMIDPAQLDEERKMALRHAGLSLLASGQRPYPQGTMPGLGANLAEALDPTSWQQRLGQVAQNGVQIRAAQQKAQREEALHAILNNPAYSAKPNEKDKERDDRLGQLSNALQAAGFMDEAKAAADLRSTLRSPPIGVHGDQYYDTRTGEVLGSFPKELATVGGAQLHSDALRRLAPYEGVSRDVETINRIRAIPAGPLNVAESQQLIEAAERVLNARKVMDASESGLAAVEHMHVVGPLARIVGKLIKTDPMSLEQRRELMAVVDPMITQLAGERDNTVRDIQRIYHENFTDPASYDRMWNSLPVSRNFGINTRAGIPRGEASPDEMNRDRLRTP